MTDILADLRAVQKLNGDTFSSAEVLGMVERAADEIEKLLAERDTWDRRVAYDELKAREYENRATQQGQINRLTIKNERLLTALAEIQDHGGVDTGNPSTIRYSASGHLDCRRMARAALTGKTP